MVKRIKTLAPVKIEYDTLLSRVSELLEAARQASVRSVNTIITLTYWNIGWQIVEHEQSGDQRAAYGKTLLAQLSADLTAKYGRGFSKANLEYMRRFYRLWSIPQTVSGESKAYSKQLEPHKNQVIQPSSFPLPWSHYVRLLSVEKQEARSFYEEEAVRGGWSIRQLDRQIGSQFYERTLLSKNKAAMLLKGQKSKTDDIVTPEEEIKDPYILEFLDLKDEYSENDLEEALVRRLEAFLLELGGDFTFVGRQKRLRVDDEWYRVDLVFYHRRLRCLVIVDLKLGKLTHADVGQMHLYLSYARAHWTHNDENPPVGLILCASKGETLVKYALHGLPNKVLAAEYKMALPDEKILVAELNKSRKRFENDKGRKSQK
jgi:predicted nuclease of restriction endonuclease-like (RecB) superfamily